MNEVYYKDDSGQLIPDRRSNNNMEVQQAVLKLLAKVESMDANIETKLEAVKDKISNLDEKVFNNIALKEKQIEELKKKLDEHVDVENDVLTDHDKRLDVARQYITRIEVLERKYGILDEKVTALEQAPVVKKASFVDGVSVAIKNAFFVAIGASAVGFVGFLILQYIKTL